MPTKWGYPDKIRVELFDRSHIATELEKATGVKRTLYNAQAYREAVDKIVDGLRNRLRCEAHAFVRTRAAAVGLAIVEAEREAKRQAARHEPSFDDIIEDLRHYHQPHHDENDAAADERLDQYVTPCNPYRRRG